jgi:hypothetical protein
MPITHRKTVSVDALRQLLGESQTDSLLEKLNPPKQTVHAGTAELRLAGKLFADPLAESKDWERTTDVVRRYFLERGQARRYFLAWVRQALDDSADGSAAATAPQRRTRRRVTDPAVLEKRRAALAKAREVRSQRLREQRAGN